LWGERGKKKNEKQKVIKGDDPSSSIQTHREGKTHNEETSIESGTRRDIEKTLGGGKARKVSLLVLNPKTYVRSGAMKRGGKRN